VAKHPEAKSYYTLAATSVKFSFPPPGSLMGVRSNTRAILKLSGCTFTYPGRTSPSLHNVSCALTLSRYVTFLCINITDAQPCNISRVGVVGPNGAGKSTLIKLLTVCMGNPYNHSGMLKFSVYRGKPCRRKAQSINTHHYELDMFLSTPPII
jgi:hypothetical protein